jgi:hypothetical protein
LQTHLWFGSHNNNNNNNHHQSITNLFTFVTTSNVVLSLWSSTLQLLLSSNFAVSVCEHKHIALQHFPHNKTTKQNAEKKTHYESYFKPIES